jgi:hypothetical protein
MRVLSGAAAHLSARRFSEMETARRTEAPWQEHDPFLIKMEEKQWQRKNRPEIWTNLLRDWRTKKMRIPKLPE